MSKGIEYLDAAAQWLARHRAAILPFAAVAMIFVILMPLPPLLMDVLLIGSITLAVLVLLTTIHVASPLEFGVFPSVLLAATLFRLVLNVGTTRLILTAGAAGRSPDEAIFAAGNVIHAFGGFVTMNSLAVGVILFVMIFIIQFVVITRGAARVSEVAARFTLDAMPGKQLAIDAEMKAGLIGADEARRRRRRIGREADFYGAMDGASKFIRGDAVAALLITLVNIVGGLYVGVAQYGWGWSRTLSVFTRLTIGDGLVQQIPALVISVSAALLVTRNTDRTNLGDEVARQLVSRPPVLAITAILLAAMMFTNLPKLPLLMFAAGCAALAWMLLRRRRGAQDETVASDHSPAAPAASPDGPLQPMEAMRVELGFSLVRLLEGNRRDDLLAQLAGLRRQLAEELGFHVPAVKICDNMELDGHGYAILIRGARVASGRLWPPQLLAVADGEVTGRLVGREAEDGFYDDPAVWIGSGQEDRALRMGYSVHRSAEVLMTHLQRTVRRYAAELLSRQQVADLIEALRAVAPSLVRAVDEQLQLGQIHKVLQSLLGERVSIRDLETILEAVSDEASRTDRMDVLTEHVRGRLGKTLSQQHCSRDGKLWCVSCDRDLEDAVGTYVSSADSGRKIVPADLAGRVSEALTHGLSRLQAQGRPQVVLCSPRVRPVIRELIAPAWPEAAVLSYGEIDTVEIQSIANIGIE